jgi:RNA polymerase sigma-70 factor (ECF subfamily)
MEPEVITPDTAGESAAPTEVTGFDFTAAYVEHREAVYRFLRAQVGSDDEALELTAVTFERAWAAFPRYKETACGMAPWFLRIARNAALDEVRRRRRRLPIWLVRTESDYAPQEDEPEAHALRSDERRRLRALLDQLPDLQRDAVALKFGAGLTAREIGQVLGRSEEAAQKLVSRGLARLKEAYSA